MVNATYLLDFSSQFSNYPNSYPSNGLSSALLTILSYSTFPAVDRSFSNDSTNNFKIWIEIKIALPWTSGNRWLSGSKKRTVLIGWNSGVRISDYPVIFSAFEYNYSLLSGATLKKLLWKEAPFSNHSEWINPHQDESGGKCVINLGIILILSLNWTIYFAFTPAFTSLFCTRRTPPKLP